MCDNPAKTKTIIHLTQISNIKRKKIKGTNERKNRNYHFICSISIRSQTLEFLFMIISFDLQSSNCSNHVWKTHCHSVAFAWKCNNANQDSVH